MAEENPAHLSPVPAWEGCGQFLILHLKGNIQRTSTKSKVGQEMGCLSGHPLCCTIAGNTKVQDCQ